MSNPVKNCRWVLVPYSEGVTAVYCEKPVTWTMEEDGGESGAPRVRVYKSFCAEHQQLVDAEDE